MRREAVIGLSLRGGGLNGLPPRSAFWVRRHPLACFVLQAACFWPVWWWYAERINDGSDEPWGLAALIAAFAFTWPRHGRLRFDPADGLVQLSAMLTLLYALATPFAPPLVRALLAVTAVACTWSSMSGARARLPAMIVLLAISLPVIASMQFYLGYPLRAITAAGAGAILSVGGYAIERVGTAMQWQDHTVLVDAACSGVRMLWAGAFLVCVLAARQTTVRWTHLLAVLSLTLPVVLIANMFRAAALFLLEIQPEPPSALLHSLVGATAFTILALGLVGIDALVRRYLPPTERPTRRVVLASEVGR